MFIHPNENVSPVVLIGSSDAKSTDQLKKMIEVYGSKIVIEQESSALLHAFEKHQPQLVLLGEKLLDKSGFEICKAIRALNQGQVTPLFMLVNPKNRTALEAAYEAGATDFIPYPLEIDGLKHHLRFYLDHSQKIEQLYAHYHKNNSLLEIIPETIMTLSPSGECLEFSTTDGGNFLVDPPKRKWLIGKSITEIFPVEISDLFRHNLHLLFTYNKPRVFEYSLPNVDEQRFYEARLVKHKDLAIVILRDITKLKSFLGF